MSHLRQGTPFQATAIGGSQIILSKLWRNIHRRFSNEMSMLFDFNTYKHVLVSFTIVYSWDTCCGLTSFMSSFRDTTHIFGWRGKGPYLSKSWGLKVIKSFHLKNSMPIAWYIKIIWGSHLASYTGRVFLVNMQVSSNNNIIQ